MGFWAPAEKLLYYVLFPCMLIEKLTYANSHNDALFSALGLAIGGNRPRYVIAKRITAFQARFRRALYLDLSGGIRFSSYIGLAAIQATLGESAISAAAICMAIDSADQRAGILAFSLYAPGGTPGWNVC